jgi:uncharacterized membrane protein
MDLIGSVIFAVGSLICHQRPDRSFFWGEQQFPVCARCTGLYLSAAFGLIGWVVVKTAQHGRRIRIDPRMARIVLIVVALPTAVSLTSGALGVWDGSNMTRALLALPFGAAAGVIVAAVATKDLR